MQRRGGLRQTETKRHRTGSGREEQQPICRYLESNVDRMRYDNCLRRGYSTATGVMEGGHRHFVKDQMGSTGMRWR